VPSGTKIVTSFLNTFKLSAMSPKILLAALVVTAFTSCSTAYRSGQTPDDVYYSPLRTVRYEEEKEKEEERRDQARNDDRRNLDNPEDREIRMRIRNQRWRQFDNDYYSYNNARFYNHYCNCYCNNSGWGVYTHPYANPSPWYMMPNNNWGNNWYVPGGIRFNNPPVAPRVTNLGGYATNTPVRVTTDPKTGVARPQPRYNNNNNNQRGSGLGNLIREIFTPSSGSNNSNNGTRSNSESNSNPRTYSPSSSGSSSGGSSGGSGGGVSRPGRGG
jgi:uncharacterized membrane protein YgcG